MAAPHRIAALALAVIGIGSVAWHFAHDGAAVRPPSTTPQPGEPEPTLPPAAATASPPPKSPPIEQKGMLQLPDGTSVPPLNGVANPPRLVWTNPEYAPIVRTEHNGDYDWYVHADGTYSTTLMIWRSDLERADACSYCLHPRDAVPVAPLPPEGALPPGSTGPANSGGR